VISRLPQLLCLLAAVAAVAVTGCGGDDEPQGEKLPPEVTQALLKQLDSISDRVAAGVSGACDDIYSEDSGVGNIGPIDEALASIPSDVDPEIRSALEQSVERLTQLVDQECEEIRSAESDQQDTTTDETTPTETVTTETETVPTETTDTTTTPPETTPTTPTTPSAPPNGNGPDGNGPPGQDRGGAEAPGGD
jgi:hypothetical protein